MPFQPGDILVSMNFKSIYAYDDVAALLFYHATNKDSGGIDKPIHFDVIRGNTLVSGATTYWFNKSYFEQGDRKARMATEGGTVIWEAFDGMTLGFGEDVLPVVIKGMEVGLNGMAWVFEKFGSKPIQRVNSPSVSDMRWGFTQVEAMRRQWYKDASFFGKATTFLISIPGQALKRGGSKGLSKFVSSRFGTVAIEAGEVVVSSLADRSPLQSDAELVEGIKQDVPLTVGEGLVQGFFKGLK